MTFFEPDFMRGINVVLSMAAAAILIASSVARFDHLSKQEIRVLPWLVVLLLIIAYGSGEAASQDAPVGYRVLMLGLALLGFIGAMVYGLREHDDKS